MNALQRNLRDPNCAGESVAADRAPPNRAAGLGTGRCVAMLAWLLGAVALVSPGGPAAAQTPNPAEKAMEQWGWTPMPGSTPPFSCTDDSYARAVKDGVTFGTYNLQPYLYKAENGDPQGLEWELLKATLSYAGITNIKLLYAEYGTLLPGLQAKRLDLFPAHETPERLKLIQFTGPVYWYGPVIAVPTGNPAKIQSYDDLVKPDVTVGVVKGSAAQLYVERVHGHIVPYADELLELASLADGRESAVLEDAPIIAQYLKSKPNAKIEALTTVQLPATTLADLGYSYFRWGIRKEDCSLGLAISRALIEVRANGVVRNILQKSGMGEYAKVSVPGLSD
jgi:polar amino acid transport system substrate-binding protein